MDEYKSMYQKLFNQITNAIKDLESEVGKLKEIQIITEEIFMAAERDAALNGKRVKEKQ